MFDPASADVNFARGSAQAHERVAEEVTRLIAAVALADEGFPDSAQLPRLAPIPHNHLGHNVLLDYKTLAAILWGTIEDIQKTIAKNPWNVLAPVLGFLAGALALAAAFPFIKFYAILVGFVLGMVVFQALLPDIEQIIADIRARNMQLLLAGNLPPSATAFLHKLSRPLAEWGDGALGEKNCPVLVITDDNQPFPGYGRHQARQLFVCRPDDEKELPAVSPESLEAAVRATLLEMGASSGIACVSSGRVVLMDGRSLRKTSPWLRQSAASKHPLLAMVRGPDRPLPGEGGPPLFIDADDMSRVQEIDPEASVRVYTCVQALVPEYLMCVTFFIRTFLSGNSASCEVCVSTLGPPRGDWNYIRGRLSLYERQKKKSAGNSKIDREQLQKASALGLRLLRIRLILENTSDTFKSKQKHGEVHKLDPFDQEAREHEQKEIKQIAENKEMWAGIFTEQINWREWNSLTFTTDFFGNPESRAVVQTLYDRICRSALLRLKDLGFDISDYKDDKGKFSLRADKIEQLVVGERVYMEKNAEKNSAKPKETDKTGESE